MISFCVYKQNFFQRDMMCKFGSTCVCVDTTYIYIYVTNLYDFFLITLLVVDEYGEGVPVAWAIANREDTTILTEFFKAVKARTGLVKPMWLICQMMQNSFSLHGKVSLELMTPQSCCVHGILIEMPCGCMYQTINHKLRFTTAYKFYTDGEQ